MNPYLLIVCGAGAVAAINSGGTTINTHMNQFTKVIYLN